MTASQTPATTTTLSHDQIKEHNSTDDCWIVLHSKVYDVTAFLDEHPGGSAIIMKFAGADATAAFDEVHAPTIVEKGLSVESFLGVVDHISGPPEEAPVVPTSTINFSKPPLQTLLSVHDFEDVARRTFTAKAFAFYSSAATDLVSHRLNLRCHNKLLLRPRVLRNVRDISLKRSILGCQSSAPFFVSPAAMARLAHPDGELAIARACAKQGIIQSISNNASFPLADVVNAGQLGQPFFFQLYVNSDRAKTEAMLRDVKSLGIKALLVTVDAPVPGKREADERIAAGHLVSAVSGAVATNDKKGGGLGRVMAKYIDPTLVWEDLAWLKRASGLPVVLKGIQTAVDARKAMAYGAAGIMLSNHGGRSLDTTQPAMVTLLELHKHCPEIFNCLQVLVDGGFTRGTDILKAIALGATAVGIGRPFLYSLTYGEEGASHLIDILKDELENSMKLIGITDVDQAHPGLVNTSLLEPFVRGDEEHPWIEWTPRAKM